MSVKLAAVVFSMAAAFPLAAQIAVGPNVQVSSAHPADSHWDVIAAADLKDPARLIASSFLFPDVGGVAQTGSTLKS